MMPISPSLFSFIINCVDKVSASSCLFNFSTKVSHLNKHKQIIKNFISFRSLVDVNVNVDVEHYVGLK